MKSGKTRNDPEMTFYSRSSNSKVYNPVLNQMFGNKRHIIAALTVYIIHKSNIFLNRYWDQKGHPINRFAGYLVKKGLWDEAKEKEWKETSRKEVNSVYSWK